MSLLSQWTNSFLAWEGIEKIAETKKGFLIWPQPGVHIYLPKRLLAVELLELMREKIQKLSKPK